MKILERLRLENQIKNIPLGGISPKLEKELKEAQEQLNSILNKWKFGDTPLKSASEFLNSFEPWINNQLEQQKELKVFLSKKGVKSLKELEDLPTDESEQLKFYKENIKIKEDIINKYKEQEQTWKNTEQDYLKRIGELEEWSQGQHNRILELEASKGDSEETEDLITERDEAIREKKTLEQENLALNNRLNLKSQEVNNKDKALEKLKKEASQKEISLNKKLTEKNTLITTLNQEIKQHKEKYTKQGKLLDTEQLECKRLEEENEKLIKEIDEKRQMITKMHEALMKLDPEGRGKVDL